MKKIKKYLPSFIFLLALIGGIALYFLYKDYPVNSREKFFVFSLIIIGFVGTITYFFITLSNKKIKKAEDLNGKEISKDNFFIKYENIKPKKNICHYCKFKYDDDLGKCPNCGAPPNN